MRRIEDIEMELFMARVREGCERIARREATAEQILDEMFPPDEGDARWHGYDDEEGDRV